MIPAVEMFSCWFPSAACCSSCPWRRVAAGDARNGRESGADGQHGGDERPGVTVTKEVPHSKETISEIKDREMTNPLPARGDTAIHSHKIPRTVNDNCMSITPGTIPR